MIKYSPHGWWLWLAKGLFALRADDSAFSSIGVGTCDWPLLYVKVQALAQGHDRVSDAGSGETCCDFRRSLFCYMPESAAGCGMAKSSLRKAGAIAC